MLPLTLRGTLEPHSDHVRAAGAVGAGEERGAACRAAWRRARRASSSARRRAITRSGCCAFFGADVRTEESGGATRITVLGDAELQGRDVVVPGDPSSAAFLAAAALIVPGSEITIEGVLVNPTRIGFYETLMEMGGDVDFHECARGRRRAGRRHPRAVLRAQGRARAGGAGAVDDRRVSDAGRRRGLRRRRRRVMEGLAELKVKESDRLAATAAGLAANGVRRRRSTAIRSPSTARGIVEGGGTVATHLDHRIAMAFLTLGLAAREAGDGRRHDHDRDELSRVPRADGGPRRALSSPDGSRAMIIAIDGPAASGKGTLAKRVAEHFGIPCLDTGLLYRAVARDVAARGFRLDDIWAAVARGARPRSRRRSTIPICAEPTPEMPPRSWPGSPRCARRCSTISAPSPGGSPAARARRPRYRHRGLPGRGR